MRKVTLVIGEYYHVYNRGTDKRKIFNSVDDYSRFLSLLYLCNSLDNVHLSNLNKEEISVFDLRRSGTIVDIGAYCLMPNHFHLLLKENSEGGISKFMQKLSTAYTMYFNKKHERTGALLQGVFKSTHANKDEYLKYLFSYIHLNPVKLIEPSWRESGIRDKHKAQSFLKNFKYSSLPDFLDIKPRKEARILNREAFPDYFGIGDTAHLLELESWLNYEEDVPNIKAKP